MAEYVGYAGAAFSEAEVNHPQAWGGAYSESNIDLAEFIKELDNRGFLFMQSSPANFPGATLRASDFEYIVGNTKWNPGAVQGHGRTQVLVRNKKSKQLWLPDYWNTIRFDMWLTLAQELTLGWGFKPE